ncbi:MAG: hypothetical protein AAFX96_13590, partial [Pseudomonadota bacterium]
RILSVFSTFLQKQIVHRRSRMAKFHRLLIVGIIEPGFNVSFCKKVEKTLRIRTRNSDWLAVVFD